MHSNNPNDDLRDEYEPGTFKRGVRGKYSSQYHRSVNLIRIDADLMKHFATSEAINAALRSLVNSESETSGDATE